VNALTTAELDAYKLQVARVVCKKVRYVNHASAQLMLDYLLTQGRDERRAYRCFMCGGWHLTSRSEPERPKR
jgi:hypothetical protein